MCKPCAYQLKQFADLTSSFGSYAESKRDERRRSARVDVSVSVTLTFLDQNRHANHMNVNLCDFSARGLAVLLDKHLESGGQFITHLPGKRGGVTNLLCTVVHCRKTSDGRFRIGAEFTCALPAPATKDTAADDLQAKRIRESMLG